MDAHRWTQKKNIKFKSDRLDSTGDQASSPLPGVSRQTELATGRSVVRGNGLCCCCCCCCCRLRSSLQLTMVLKVLCHVHFHPEVESSKMSHIPNKGCPALLQVKHPVDLEELTGLIDGPTAKTAMETWRYLSASRSQDWKKETGHPKNLKEPDFSKETSHPKIINKNHVAGFLWGHPGTNFAPLYGSFLWGSSWPFGGASFGHGCGTATSNSRRWGVFFGSGTKVGWRHPKKKIWKNRRDCSEEKNVNLCWCFDNVLHTVYNISIYCFIVSNYWNLWRKTQQRLQTWLMTDLFKARRARDFVLHGYGAQQFDSTRNLSTTRRDQR